MTGVLTSVPNYADLQAVADRFDLNAAQKHALFGVSPRNQARYKQTNPELNDLVADRLARFQRLTDLAISVFEDEAEAKHWLATPKEAFDRHTPLEMMVADAGSRQVEDLLTRIEYGVYG